MPSSPVTATPGTSVGRPRAGDVDRHVGARIRERRLGLGLSLQEVAELAGSTYQQQHKYEKGVNRISAGRLHAIARALGPVVAGDAVLCSDGAKAYATFAAGHGVRHEPVNLAAGVRVRDGAFHIRNVNAYHGRLKGWMGRFDGVATRYLPNHLGWRRTLERAPEPSASKTWLLAAVRPISIANAN